MEAESLMIKDEMLESSLAHNERGFCVRIGWWWVLLYPSFIISLFLPLPVLTGYMVCASHWSCVGDIA